MAARLRSDQTALRLALLVILSGIVTALTIAPVRETLSLWALGAGPRPYFIPSHALSLYLVTPAAALAASFFFLAPGLVLAAGFGREKGAAHWLVAGLAAALVVNTAAVTAAELLLGRGLTGASFVALIGGLNGACIGLLALRMAGGTPLRVSLKGQGGDLLAAAVLFWVALILMAPKFYWENFSGDGSGSLQFTRNLIHSHWPFWSPEAGVIQQAPGLTSFLFVIPDSWFVRLWGEWEFSVRILTLTALALLYPVLTALIRHGRPGAELRPADHLLLMAALGLYAFANIYSGGYHAWFGDSPMPAARETLAMVAFMGYILAFLDNRRALMVTAGVMAHLSIPTGGLWLLLWPIAVWLVGRPRPIGALRTAALTLAVAAAISVLVPVVVKLAGLPIPGNEFSAEAVVQRLRFVAFTDWNRFAFLAVPCGLLPALALLTWRRQDRTARALTLLTLAFFLFFYLQGYRVLLHHFIPAMIPPLVVMWRSDLMERAGAQLAVALGLLAALWLAWPKDVGLHHHDRDFAAFIATEGPRYASAAPAEGEKFRGFDPKALDTFHELFGRLLPIGYGESEPGERFFGAPLVWWYYSEFPKAEGQTINYVLKPLADATPDDGTLFDSYDGYGLFIRDMALFEAHRTQRLPIDTGASLLATPRPVLFGRGAHWPESWSDRTVIDLVGIAKAILGKS
ncbi:hypothetical protein OU426_00270 [Frigidibacter sp. RF13]|uniref:hypothetical protein n=1 Tax=Frigidibacter sp. RF13 TaxID=2997340 RepID=UPI00226D9650|nr:hypothetical protein [Frigidibacter sp. RF13]MCY1125277.1 hypothetical protein [Frigidibacter sp. RF13]